jgi:hypothetical protein
MRDACTIKIFRDNTTKVTPPEVTYFHSRPLKIHFEQKRADFSSVKRSRQKAMPVK